MEISSYDHLEEIEVRIWSRIGCWVVAGSLAIAMQSFAGDWNQIQTYQVSRGGTLNVSVSDGDIRVIPWEKNEVSVRMVGSFKDDWGDFRVVQNGNTVAVRGSGDVNRIEASVPSKFNLDLKTSNGDIEIFGAMTGSLSGSTSGGDIQLEDVVGQLTMHTSGGSIEVGKIDGDARLHTSGGDVDVQLATGTLDIATSGGSVSVGNVMKTLKARSGGGTIEIGDVGGTATISTGGGDVIVGKVSGNAKLTTGGGSIQLGGGSGEVTVTTGGGDMVLRNISGVVNGKTAGGDVYAELTPSTLGASRLVSAGGDIELRIPASAKATIEAVIRIRGRWADGLHESEIISDFKATSREEDSERKEIRASFSLNGGGYTIYLETVNGSIQIRKY